MTREGGMTIGTPLQLAQQGALGRFIEREGITFDPETLTIRVKRNN
jgi:iron complex transport system ATP-binding protein